MPFLLRTCTTLLFRAEQISRSPFGSWIRRECHRKGGIVEARLKSYSKAAAVLCIAHITTVIGELLPWRDSQTSNCIWGNQDLSRSIFISNHFQGGSSQTKISSQNTFLEDLGLAIWQRTFDKKSCKVLLLRTTCSPTHCLDCCTHCRARPFRKPGAPKLHLGSYVKVFLVFQRCSTPAASALGRNFGH